MAYSKKSDIIKRFEAKKSPSTKKVAFAEVKDSIAEVKDSESKLNEITDSVYDLFPNFDKNFIMVNIVWNKWLVLIRLNFILV